MKSVFVTILFIMTTALFGGNFDLKTLEGNTIHIRNLDGNFIFTDKKYAKRPVLLFFFGTRCPYCERDIPRVAKLAADKKIAVVGIQAQFPVNDEILEEFAHQEDIDFAVLSSKDGDRLVRYLQKRKMWLGGVPYYILIDKYGNLEPTDLETVLERLNF